MNPDPFTMRELWTMAEAKWCGVSQLMAVLANVNRDKKKRAAPFDETDFPLPLVSRKKRRGNGQSVKGNLGILRTIVVKK